MNYFITKPPKGCRDFTPNQMHIIRNLLIIIRQIFQQFGAVEIDTPVFELKETLQHKYGENSKLIYDLQDQGGELLSLRYDLTVPFARYMANNNLERIKRFQIGKVYRRDQPAMMKGRFREFYQCDFDIAGNYESLIADAQVIQVMNQVLTQIQIGPFQIRLNCRKLMNHLLNNIGINDDQQILKILSIIDKNNRQDQNYLNNQLNTLQFLSPLAKQQIIQICSMQGQPHDILQQLKNNIDICKDNAKLQIGNIQKLIEYLNYMGIEKNILFDLSLVRGLDYYTGIIFEAELINSNKNELYGSIAGGGRYDNLIGMFSGKKINSVGMSIGIERILSYLENQLKNQQKKINYIDIFIITIGQNLVSQKLQIASLLISNNIKTDYIPEEDPKLQKQMQQASESGAKYALFIGEDEIKQNKLKLKNLGTGEQFFISKQELIEFLQKNISD